MLKKSFKYIVIAIVNSIVLTVLLGLWTDKLELTFNDWVRPKEFIKILGFSFLSLMGMWGLNTYFRHKKIITTSLKTKAAVLLTFLISSYLYVDYSTRIISNAILNRQFRNQIVLKIKPSHRLANGTQGENLTIKEYQQITKMFWFPSLPAEASNINYAYEYDGFLPDYLFTLTYDLPAQMKVDTINFKKGDFSKYQSFVTIDKIKRVTYIEGEQ